MTRWTLVGLAAEHGPEAAQQALETLLVRDRPALLIHLVRAKGLSPDGAEDLVQGFIFDRIIAGDLIRRARERGSGRGACLPSSSSAPTTTAPPHTPRERGLTAHRVMVCLMV